MSELLLPLFIQQRVNVPEGDAADRSKTGEAQWSLKTVVVSRNRQSPTDLDWSLQMTRTTER